jgi:hypothetical protein
MMVTKRRRVSWLEMALTLSARPMTRVSDTGR